MAKKHHRQRLVVYASPPPASPKPAEPLKPAAAKPDLFDWLVKAVAIVIFGVGAVTIAAPWLHRAERPLPQAGLVCWRIERSTSAGRTYDTGCEPAPGWHAERSPTAGLVVIPDDAEPVRRRYVRD
jgi:hypothetical protein